jgi:uncharacterized protein YfcZ (UPF0381/DUF406 family)
MENVVCCKFDIHSEASMLQYDAYKKVNNVYENSQQAEQHIENLKTKAELRELANELNGDEVIDWGNENQNKYRLFYNYDRHGVTWGAENNISKAQGAIYCLDEDFLLKAIERIGEQRLIEMIRSGV